MRPGGGKEKGAEFERQTGVKLSLWLTQGARADLFARNVLSGGVFTLAGKKGLEQSMPGDLMAAHPMAFEFLSNFLIECKHHASLGLETYLYDFKQASPFAKIIALSAEQAATAKLQYMVIARQNRRDTLVFMPSAIGVNALSLAKPRRAFRYHKLHRDTIMCCPFEDLTSLVRADHFIASLPVTELRR